jgi:hypothetical protein
VTAVCRGRSAHPSGEGMHMPRRLQTMLAHRHAATWLTIKVDILLT